MQAKAKSVAQRLFLSQLMASQGLASLENNAGQDRPIVV